MIGLKLHSRSQRFVLGPMRITTHASFYPYEIIMERYIFTYDSEVDREETVCTKNQLHSPT